jgi:acetyl esterase/lipase
MLKRLCRMTVMTIATAFLSACSNTAYFIANVPSFFGAYQRHADKAYGRELRQQLDIYQPKHVRAAPVVIFWYGGSWLRGEKSQYRFVAAALAQKGFVAVIPDYRLYPEVKFPQFLDDGAQAVAWTQKNIARFGGDPQKVFLMGHSAGAHMATWLAFNEKLLLQYGTNLATIRGVVGLSGPYTLTPNSDVLRKIFAAPYTPRDWQPIAQLSTQAPAVFLIHGTKDNVVSLEQARRLQIALQQRRLNVTLKTLRGRSHADTVAAFAWATRYRAPVLADVTDFISRLSSDPPHAPGDPSR